MYVVRCPHCRHMLKIDRPVREARSKCRGCGAVFVGSSEETPDTAPAGKAAPPPVSQAPPQAPGGYPQMPYHHGAPRKRTPAWIWIAAPATALSMIILGVALYYFGTHPYRTIPDERGGFIKGRFTDAETEKIIREVERKRAEIVLAESRKPHAPVRERAHVETPDSGTTFPTQPRSVPRPPERPVTEADRNIRVTGVSVVHSEIPGSGTITGEIWNNSDSTVVSVEVIVEFSDASGQRRMAAGVICRYIPAKERIYFSAEFDDIPADQLRDVRAFARSTVTDPSLICWNIDRNGCRIKSENRGRTVALRGETRNETGADVAVEKIYCDFFALDGIHLCSAEGKLDTGFIIRSGKLGFFKITFDAAEKGVMSPMIENLIFRARVVGRIH